MTTPVMPMKSGNAFRWPMAQFGLPALEGWIDGQQRLLADATKVGQELMAISTNSMHLALGMTQRMMAARTPEEFLACQRDLLELVTAKYFEQVMKVTDRMETVLAPNEARAAKHHEDAVGKDKAA
jgi:hypothetical protein